MRTRSAGWIAGSILIGAALLAPAAALAQEGNQTDINSETWGGNLSCTGGPDGDFTVTPNEVVWVFVHAGVGGPGILTANFAGADQVTTQSYIQGGIKYAITTARPETLLSFSDDIAGGVLTLSHICRNDPPTTPPTTPPSDDPSVPPPPPPPSDDPSVPPPPPSASPSSSVEAVTGTPRITPPPTDAMGGDSSSGAGWGIVMLAIGGLAALALLASPVRRCIRR